MPSGHSSRQLPSYKIGVAGGHSVQIEVSLAGQARQPVTVQGAHWPSTPTVPCGQVTSQVSPFWKNLLLHPSGSHPVSEVLPEVLQLSQPQEHSLQAPKVVRSSPSRTGEFEESTP